MKIFKYFFEFISIISLFSIFKIIGLRNASNLGGFLGKFFGPIFRSKQITKQNIKIGLGEIDEKKESEIINDMWSNIGRTFAEYVFLKDFYFLVIAKYFIFNILIFFSIYNYAVSFF